MLRIAGGAAVALMLATAGCSGSSEEGSKPGANAAEEDKPSSDLPSAGTMAEIETFVSARATCLNLSVRPNDPDQEWVGEEWGIKERGVCGDENQAGTNLLVVNDMKAFQTQAKKQRRAYFIGKDFAVYAQGSTTKEALQDSGLLFLVCKDREKIPSGYKKEPALVNGCVLTDYAHGF
ncbi:hypothetical protein ACIO87_31805 [Streptomyces sp. NPDC087218]|uniref:hypothetical protein n=1 Tax=Streptomyces sp. NPDC087218 TaxID=3365769 RepID=UPI00381B9CA6